MTKILKCVVCGKVFTTNDKRFKTCSRECSEKLSKIHKYESSKKQYLKNKDTTEYKERMRERAKNYYLRNKNNPEFIKKKRAASIEAVQKMRAKNQEG